MQVGSECRFDSRHWQFFFHDDGGATSSSAGNREAQALTCQNERSKCRCKGFDISLIHIMFL